MTGTCNGTVNNTPASLYRMNHNSSTVNIFSDLSRIRTQLYYAQLSWVVNIKYRGCFFINYGDPDFHAGTQEFHGNFNDILSVLYQMSAMFLIISSLSCGCEIWSLHSSDYHQLDVVWSNAFRKRVIAAAETASPLLRTTSTYCRTLPL